MASEIRVNQIQSRTGVSTVSFTDSGPIFAGISTVQGTLIVDGGITARSDNITQTSITSLGDDSDIRTTRLNFNFSDGGGAAIAAKRSAGVANTETYLSIRTGGSTNNDEKIRIEADGKVGIGTENPTEKLYVVGDARVTGNFTLPGQERFLSYKTGDQAANDADSVTVGFPAATYDTAGGFDNINNRYVVQNSGFFHFYTQILITTTTANTLREAAISIERSTDSGSNWTVLTTSAARGNSTADLDTLTFNCSIMSELNAGDYLRVGAFCNTGDASTWSIAHNPNDALGGNFNNTGNVADYDSRITYFMGVRIA